MSPSFTLELSFLSGHTCGPYLSRAATLTTQFRQVRLHHQVAFHALHFFLCESLGIRHWKIPLKFELAQLLAQVKISIYAQAMQKIFK